MSRTIKDLKADLAEAKKWLKEARDRYWGAKSNADDLERWDNETDEHFKARKERLKERVSRREEVKNHLAKKVDQIEDRIKERQAGHDDPAGPDPDGDGVAIFDGKTVAAWMVPWLEKSRAAGWHGVVVSGYRTPEYSTSLCMNMCGAPSCPGRCAGASSNHSGKVYPAGAVDVSDYGNFEQIQFRIGSPLRNDLPIDPVHFSVSGH